jgi:hypothetical protein
MLPCILMLLTHISEVEKQYILQMKHQYARNWVENHLETEKHILRQIQGMDCYIYFFVHIMLSSNCAGRRNSHLKGK